MPKKYQEKVFGSYIERNVRVIKRSYLRAFKDLKLDITPEQWVMIDKLAQENGQSQNELAAACFKDAPTTSRIIDLLCKKGWTERRRFENDQRRHKIFLTTKGRGVYKKALPKVQGLRKKGWQGLSDRDYASFLRIMNRIADNFSE